MKRIPLPTLALATLGAVALGAVVGILAAREALICRTAGPADPTPEDVGAAEARDYMRWLDGDGEW